MVRCDIGIFGKRRKVISQRCCLCAKFFRQERLEVYDFNAEPLAAEFPYYQLQQGLIDFSLRPGPSRWRQAIDLEPILSNNIGHLQFDSIVYVARIRSYDYTYEYWDVYLEPDKGGATAFLYRLKLIIHAEVK